MILTMANDVAAYDYCSFILLLIVIIYFLRMSVRGTYRARIMGIIVLITLLASAFDATRVRFAGLDVVSDMRFFNINCAFLFSLSCITPLFLMYVIPTTDT